jgi:L-lactate dehydrogenase complex protein LldE
MEGLKVQVLVTCMVDALAPRVGQATVSVLELAGCEVGFPSGQTCCGQPAFNVGLDDEARRMAAHTLDILDSTEGPVVVPSGSCAKMVIHHYPELFAGTDREAQATRVAGRTRELTEFLVDDLGSDVRGECGNCTVAYQHSCHGLRGLGVGHQAETLLESVSRAELDGPEECCGFGGLFSIEMPSVSTAILNEKLDRIVASGAGMVVGGDISCLLHIEGGLRRRGDDVAVRHIAEILGIKP